MQIYVEAKSSFDWLSALTTLLSVILGAVLAYTGTRVSERRKEHRERIAKATLLSLKFRNVVDGIFRLDRQLTEGMQKADAAGVKGPPWTRFEQISAIGDYEEVITVEDMAVLAESGHYDLIEEITELRDGHNSIIRALVQIYGLRDQLAEAIPPQEIRGNVASFEGELSPDVALLIINLNSLSASVMKSLDELKTQARSAAPQVHAKLKASLKVKVFPKVTVPAETAADPDLNTTVAKEEADSRRGKRARILRRLWRRPQPPTPGSE